MPLLMEMQIPATIEAIECTVEALTALNFYIMTIAKQKGGGFPPLFESGIVYRRERGTERWQNAIDLLRAGEGDCEDLAAYYAAELRMKGIPARVAIVKTRRDTYHAVVELPDGQLVDPSRIALQLEHGYSR